MIEAALEESRNASRRLLQDPSRGRVFASLSSKDRQLILVLFAMNTLNTSLLLTSLLVTTGCSTLAPEKQIRRTIHADYTVQDPEFGRSIGPLLSAPLVGNNQVVELVNGDEIFPAMLEAIRGAQKTITLEMYIWTSGEVSAPFVEALTNRARAGVKVHVLVDAAGSIKLSRADTAALRESGVELVRYNLPHPFRPFGMNHRTHRKLMVVDGKIGFTGGVCLSDDWSGNAEPGKWRDTHFRVEGPVVAQMQGVFMENWLQTESEVLHGEDYFPELQPSGGMMAQYFRSGPRDNAENARLSYLLSFAAAKKSIRLAHAYFVPSKLATEAMIDARRRGVRIEVIVPKKIDHFAVASASRSRWKALLEAGVEFYQYDPTLYHCKIMIVDDQWVSAGSVNFDERSFRINDEANLNVISRALAQDLIESFDADKAKSRRLSAEDFKKRNWFSRGFDQFMGLFRSQL
jgi:cardiolipin synthase